MKVLINYQPEDKGYLPVVAGMLKKAGHEAVATAKTLSMSELLALARSSNVLAGGILLANEVTLGDLVKIGRKKVTLDSFRGSRLNFSTPVIVTNPFTHIRTVQYGKWLLEKDLGKFAHLGKKPHQLPFKVLETANDFQTAETICARCLVLSIDIETATEGVITCISFTGLLPSLDTVTYVIPFVDFGQNHWTRETDYAAAIQCMQRLCLSDVPKMMFNATYDAQYLIRYHAYPRNLVIDVMGMAHSEYSELPKTLDFTASRLLWDFYQWKHEADVSKQNKEIRSYWGYCAKDSWNTLRCFLAMLPDFPQYAIRNYQMAFKLIYPCLYCSFEGVKIDGEKRAAERQKAQDIVDEKEKTLRIITATPTFNPRSPKQVARFLFDILGAKRINGDSTDGKKVLPRVAEQHPLLARIVDDLETYRGEAKAISNYYDFWQWCGRLLYSLGPFATDTSRFSSRASNFFKWNWEAKTPGPESYGTQIQNIPEYAKGMIVADDGFEMFEADNNKSEARCVAWQSNCRALMAALEDTSKDFYKVLATIFFGLKYEDVTKDMRNRLIKRICHGTNYMMGDDTFIQTCGVAELLKGAAMLRMRIASVKAFAKFLLGIYHTKFPEVRKDYVETKNEVRRTSKLVSPMGHTRHFFGNISEDHKVFRMAVAHRPQNLSVTILNRGFWKVYQLVLVSNGDLRLKAQIHDSIWGQYKDGLRAKYEPLILEAMNNPVKMHNGLTLSIPVDFAAGKTWLQVKGG